jgi:uncharacterized protein (DUF924 family)
MSPEDVLGFWFGNEGDDGYGEFREEWFRKDAAFDEEIRERFLGLYEEAAAGKHDDWREDARGAAALVIVLDQFPRNMFRDDPRTYEADGKAREAARYAVERALDRELRPLERWFLYMPFMHSEEIEDQRLALDLFRNVGKVGEADPVPYAEGHAEIVERFGRFPHRNAILGRETTVEEAKFLRGPGSSF